MPRLFLTLDEALAIHAHQITRYGGALGVCDEGLLESALAMPAATFAGEYLHPSPAEQGAAYLFHVVKNHPFVDVVFALTGTLFGPPVLLWSRSRTPWCSA